MAIHTVGELRKYLGPFTDNCPITRNGQLLNLEYHSTVNGGGYLCAAEELGAIDKQPTNTASTQCPHTEVAGSEDDWVCEQCGIHGHGE